MMRVLNIDVDDRLLQRWFGWFAPTVQPFLVDAKVASRVSDHSADVSLTPEIRDTYCLYALPSGARHIWLTQKQFMALPRSDRASLVRAQRAFGREIVPSVRSWAALLGDGPRAQADGHRFVWWPSLLHGHEQQVLSDYIEDGRRSSRHEEVPEDIWTSVSGLLPAAQRIAGNFPAASGPNCFGAVMGAAGVSGAETVWMQRDPFERWLREQTRPGGSDDDAGTVLVWRSPDGLVQHAAVTLGAGWVLHKPSQGWMSPTKVLTVAECKASSRSIGRRLHRRSLVP